MNAKTELTIDETKHSSHSKLPIERRIVRFDFSDIDAPDFYRGNPIISAYWVGLSATFPVGEAEFIRSVKLFEDQVTDEKLREEVKDFAAQEAHHSLQHKKINKHFDSLGYDTKGVEKRIGEEINKRIESWSPEKRLRRTVCVEHFTATMANYGLSNPESVAPMPASLRDMLLWHSLEEIEHKSVAFDVYKHCVGDMAKLRRHYRYFAFYEFPMNMYFINRYLLKNIGRKPTWAERKEMWTYLFGEKGTISSAKKLFMMFLNKDFHPWQHDDSALVDQWKKTLSPYFVN